MTVDLPAAAVLFDMDGTLIDSTPAVMRSWKEWGRRWLGRDDFDDIAHGTPARDIVAGLVAEPDRAEAFLDIEAREVADTAGITVLPGARELLDSLPSERWAIVTSCSRPLAHARLEAVGITPPVLITADDVRHGKPAPDPFLAAAGLLGFDAADCIVVEDAPSGLAAGAAAGSRTIGVHGTSDLTGVPATVIARDLTAVTASIGDAGVVLRVQPA